MGEGTRRKMIKQLAKKPQQDKKIKKTDKKENPRKKAPQKETKDVPSTSLQDKSGEQQKKPELKRKRKTWLNEDPSIKEARAKAYREYADTMGGHRYGWKGIGHVIPELRYKDKIGWD